MPLAKTVERISGQHRLLDDDQPHRPAAGFGGRVPLRMLQIERADRIVPQFGQLGPQQRPGPLVGHRNENAWRVSGVGAT